MTFQLYCRNLQKRANKARHDREKGYVDQLTKAGCCLGVYVGNGRGEDEATTCVTDGPTEDDLPDVEHSLYKCISKISKCYQSCWLAYS